MKECEIFKDIVGYEGLYQISNYGRVKSLGNDKTRKEKILKPWKNSYGYLYVRLSKDGKMKPFLVHRLVLQTFNPVDNMNELQVDHINMDKTDDKLSNLRYATSKEQKYFDNQDWKTHAKKVYQYTKGGSFVKEWSSIHEIERELGFWSSYISECCNGRHKSSYGYIWSYTKKDNPN